MPLQGAGTTTTGIIRCDQPRALDLGAHGGKKLESVPDEIMDEVLARERGGRRDVPRFFHATKPKEKLVNVPSVPGFSYEPTSGLRRLADRRA